MKRYESKAFVSVDANDEEEAAQLLEVNEVKVLADDGSQRTVSISLDDGPAVCLDEEEML